MAYSYIFPTHYLFSLLLLGKSWIFDIFHLSGCTFYESTFLLKRKSKRIPFVQDRITWHVTFFLLSCKLSQLPGTSYHAGKCRKQKRGVKYGGRKLRQNSTNAFARFMAFGESKVSALCYISCCIFDVFHVAREKRETICEGSLSEE